MEMSDSEKSLNASRRPFSQIDEDEDVECDNPELRVNNEIASEVIQDIDPKESEKYGIVTIIMIISITLTFIRIMQECEKNNCFDLSISANDTCLANVLRTLSRSRKMNDEKKWKCALSFYIYSIELYATHFSKIPVNRGISFLK